MPDTKTNLDRVREVLEMLPTSGRIAINATAYYELPNGDEIECQFIEKHGGWYVSHAHGGKVETNEFPISPSDLPAKLAELGVKC